MISRRERKSSERGCWGAWQSRRSHCCHRQIRRRIIPLTEDHIDSLSRLMWKWLCLSLHIFISSCLQWHTTNLMSLWIAVADKLRMPMENTEFLKKLNNRKYESEISHEDRGCKIFAVSYLNQEDGRMVGFNPRAMSCSGLGLLVCTSIHLTHHIEFLYNLIKCTV